MTMTFITCFGIVLHVLRGCCVCLSVSVCIYLCVCVCVCTCVRACVLPLERHLILIPSNNVLSWTLL